ncbi:hypothetical protein FACS189440_01200 [Bacteroidia bacterium]|nr:hypothetical protein FACS189440_01200 [Bacteroidia bacterium]
MIPKEIQALFDFIDYLDSNKKEYIENYIPLITEQKLLDEKRQKLKPIDNYKKRQQYNNIQTEISEKSTPIKNGIWNPILNKLKELKIWAGDDTFASIWNNNISAISKLKENFTKEDIVLILQHKQKYLSFREETNIDFLCLGFAFSALDEVLKELFDFFKDTEENEFENFETKTIKVNSVKEAIKILKENQNSKIAIPIETIFAKQETIQTNSKNIKNRKKWIYISIIIVIVGVVILVECPNIIDWLWKIILGITSLGGLWGAINLILNLYSKFKKQT